MNRVICDDCSHKHGVCETCGRWRCEGNEYAYCPRPITDGQREEDICARYETSTESSSG